MQFYHYNNYCILFLHGEIAQLARATGSYPVGRWFESISRYQQNSKRTAYSKILEYAVLLCTTGMSFN